MTTPRHEKFDRRGQGGPQPSEPQPGLGEIGFSRLEARASSASFAELKDAWQKLKAGSNFIDVLDLPKDATWKTVVLKTTSLLMAAEDHISRRQELPAQGKPGPKSLREIAQGFLEVRDALIARQFLAVEGAKALSKPTIDECMKSLKGSLSDLRKEMDDGTKLHFLLPCSRQSDGAKPLPLLTWLRSDLSKAKDSLAADDPQRKILDSAIERGDRIRRQLALLERLSEKQRRWEQTARSEEQASARKAEEKTKPVQKAEQDVGRATGQLTAAAGELKRAEEKAADELVKRAEAKAREAAQHEAAVKANQEKLPKEHAALKIAEKLIDQAYQQRQEIVQVVRERAQAKSKFDAANTDATAIDAELNELRKLKREVGDKLKKLGEAIKEQGDITRELQERKSSKLMIAAGTLIFGAAGAAAGYWAIPQVDLLLNKFLFAHPGTVNGWTNLALKGIGWIQSGWSAWGPTAGSIAMGAIAGAGAFVGLFTAKRLLHAGLRSVSWAKLRWRWLGASSQIRKLEKEAAGLAGDIKRRVVPSTPCADPAEERQRLADNKKLSGARGGLKRWADSTWQFLKNRIPDRARNFVGLNTSRTIGAKLVAKVNGYLEPITQAVTKTETAHAAKMAEVQKAKSEHQDTSNKLAGIIGKAALAPVTDVANDIPLRLADMDQKIGQLEAGRDAVIQRIAAIPGEEAVLTQRKDDCLAEGAALQSKAGLVKSGSAAAQADPLTQAEFNSALALTSDGVRGEVEEAQRKIREREDALRRAQEALEAARREKEPADLEKTEAQRKSQELKRLLARWTESLNKLPDWRPEA